MDIGREETEPPYILEAVAYTKLLRNGNRQDLLLCRKQGQRDLEANIGRGGSQVYA